MARQMPKDMQQRLGELQDPETIRSIQGKWNEYVATNEQYELNYPQQFAHQVEGNLKFKEQKSIPTPAEQMASFETMVREEIEGHLGDKGDIDKDPVYELDDKEQSDSPRSETVNEREGRMKDFQLSFGDMSLRDKDVPEQETPAKENDIERSQVLNVVWLKDYKEQKAQEQKEQTQDMTKAQPEQDKPYELSLTFGKLEELERSNEQIEPEQPDMEPDED